MKTANYTLNLRSRRTWRAPVAGIVVCASAAMMGLLTGCGGMLNDALSSSAPGSGLGGRLMGGQQPISGATIQLYAAQATGYGAASVPLIGATVLTDAGGNFSITGDYTCPSAPNDQVYITAVGGNSGSGVNSNIVQVAALGPCSSLSSSTFILINEVSTVAAAYALAGFATDYQHVSTSSTNYTGLKNAFATVNNLVSLSTGAALSTAPGYASAPTGTTSTTFNSVVPQAELNTLGNILASCVNTNGVGGSSTACSSLFTAAKPAGGSTPTTTFQAALDIAQNPGNNVSSLYNLASATPPFSPTLASAPNDWTIALSFVGGGMGGPSGGTPVAQTSASNQVAIDASGNVWIADYRNSRVSELSPVGTPLSNSTVLSPSVVLGGYSGAGLSNPNAIAIDLSGNAWIANSNGSLSELSNNGSAVGSGFTGSGLSGTVREVAIDTNNNVWAVSSGNSALSEFNNAGVDQTGGNGYTTDLSSPFSLAIDPSNHVWVSSGGNGYAVEFNSTGSVLYLSNPSSIQSPTAYTAIDASGRFLVPGGSPVNSIQLYSTSSVSPTTYMPTSGINPTGIAIDGVGHIFTSNGGGTASVTYAPNLVELTSGGSTLSPVSTGYLGTGTSATGTGLITTTVKGIAVDQAGNLWLVNGNNVSTVTEFIGIGAPTGEPLVSQISNNKIGQRP